MAGRAGRARPLGPKLTVSLALHLGILVLLVLTIQRRPYQAEEVPPADFAMVFEGHSPERNSGPNPDLDKPSRPGSPAPSVTMAPVPPTPPAPRPAAALPLPPPPAPQATAEAQPAPAPPPPPQTSAEAHQPPTPPAPPQTLAEARPSPAPPPPLTLGEVPTPPAPPEALPPPTAPAPSSLAMVMPRLPPIPAARPPAETRPPAPAEARPTAPTRPERRPERAPAFPTPLAFSFGLPRPTTPNSTAPSSTPPPSAPPPSVPSRIPQPGQPGTVDLSFGPIAGGSLSASASVQMEGVAVSTDWLNLVSAWWLRHRYYPPQAAANFEDGDVTMHMRVDQDGRVEALELTGKSGSQWLDLGALSVFRGAHLPPLPSDMNQAQIPFEVTVHYIIVVH
jgi:TonB family protein